MPWVRTSHGYTDGNRRRESTPRTDAQHPSNEHKKFHSTITVPPSCCTRSRPLPASHPPAQPPALPSQPPAFHQSAASIPKLSRREGARPPRGPHRRQVTPVLDDADEPSLQVRPADSTPLVYLFFSRPVPGRWVSLALIIDPRAAQKPTLHQRRPNPGPMNG
jgi:hypothetical protein